MVAPTRTPQSRGVKCDICRKILNVATWLDQTKLAKTLKDAQLVLDLIQQHIDSGCLCMPKNIENLLVGSTHFEIHRLVIKRLDLAVYKQQYDKFLEAKQNSATKTKESSNETINDCYDTRLISRFKTYTYEWNNQKQFDDAKLQLKHLTLAIDYWKLAMEDQVSLFNPKLALRLGLTHHVIYACYLFKFYKLFNYQLLSANLVLNLFKSIEGVTANAILHAEYLLVRSLLDCGQLALARQFLKKATKSPNYMDKSHYESILLTCVACELDLLEANEDMYSILDDLAALAVIKPDDKLQHYYARTLALSIIIRYIHFYPSKSDLCFEFYHTFRYLGAIIRRCYESSFEMVLWDKESRPQCNQLNEQQNQILDHSWIKFALCDFVYSTFDLLTNFYLRAGQPECLELLYNGLNLISYRSGSLFWQTRMSSIGAELDLICDKYNHASKKFDTMSRIIGHLSNSYLMNWLRLDLEVGLLALLDRQETVIKKEVVLDLLQRIKTCNELLMIDIARLEIFDPKSNSYTKMNNCPEANDNLIVPKNGLGHLKFKALKVAVSSMLKGEETSTARELVVELGQKLAETKIETLEYYNYVSSLEIMFYFSNCHQSKQLMLQEIKSSRVFLESGNDVLGISKQLSSLTINMNVNNQSNDGRQRRKPVKLKSKKEHVSRRKGIYEVASKSEENLHERHKTRLFEPMEALRNLPNLTREEIVTTYLRCCGPNPDYLLYRLANEMMFSFYLREENEPHNRDLLLYHFCELSTSNTMRYRWMMYEEQQASPFESRMGEKSLNTSARHLGFNNVLVNPEKSSRLLTKSIPEDFRLVQFKYISDESLQREHLICACYDSSDQPFFVNAYRTVTPDEVFNESFVKENDETFTALTLPSKFSTKVAEAKKTLFLSNYRSRVEKRQKIEKEMGIILHDFEYDWLGPYRFLLCGKIIDTNYGRLIDNILAQILSIMKDYPCSSKTALRVALENAPIIDRTEFCKLMEALFGCPYSSDKVRDCYNKWLKLLEAYIKSQAPNLDKINFLHTLPRGQVGLILDSHLELLPFESLPMLRIMKQGIFRVPSLRIFNILASRHGRFPFDKLNAKQTAYILDPAGNLANTRARFEEKLKCQKSWEGSISQAPKTDQLEHWLRSKEIYIFIGHGAGTTYYKRLCKGKGLGAMANIKTVSIVMGCSSGTVQAEGPQLESFGIGWMFVFRGCSSYVGLLWDVTDTDIDKFLDTLLSKWMSDQWLATGGSSKEMSTTACPAITDAVAQARLVCQSRILVGSTPVVYGLPVWCDSSQNS